jgi:isoaspartyl peptidase/L-asparaginase-like protein (Ntn-hydrolase superfamily)
MRILEQVVELCARLVEADLGDASVGRGGRPNILGEVQLDAQIMDGTTLRAGSVGFVTNCTHVSSLARVVMEQTPHVLVVGAGANHLAREVGLNDADVDPLLTAEIEKEYKDALENDFPGIDLSPTAAWRSSTDPQRPPLREWVEPLRPRPVVPDHWFGTVNFLAIDAQGNVATCVSTSGWGWCYPGRLGDSPILGAGSYADSRYGAAATTGTGEICIRTSASRSVVLYMKMGMSVSDAVDEAMADMRDLKDPYAAHINLIAVDKDGNYAGASYRPGKMFAVIRAGEEKATELNHHNPRPVPGGMETLAYRHNASTDAMGKPKL